jgi:hypothetical protein
MSGTLKTRRIPAAHYVNILTKGRLSVLLRQTSDLFLTQRHVFLLSFYRLCHIKDPGAAAFIQFKGKTRKPEEANEECEDIDCRR